MLKHSLAILSLVAGMIMFLLGCSKSNHDTIAFVGDESDMRAYYDIYPELYFPDVISQDLIEGRFPPDVVGEYEMNGTFVDGHYGQYNSTTHQYIPLPSYYCPQYKGTYIIITNQINGIAKIKYASRNHDYSEYKDWQETQAYIYGNVYSEENSNDFILCYESTEQNGDVCEYIRGNIIKGTIDASGIINIETWSVIKGKNPDIDVAGIFGIGGFLHYHADVAERKTN